MIGIEARRLSDIAAVGPAIEVTVLTHWLGAYVQDPDILRSAMRNHDFRAPVAVQVPGKNSCRLCRYRERYGASKASAAVVSENRDDICAARWNHEIHEAVIIDVGCGNPDTTGAHRVIEKVARTLQYPVHVRQHINEPIVF